jgi:putative ATP-dependent endonuclease of the OLD family
VSRDDTRSTLTHAGRKAREAAARSRHRLSEELAREVQTQEQAIGTTKFGDLRPGLDMSLTNTQGNLALFDGDIPLANFGQEPGG